MARSMRCISSTEALKCTDISPCEDLPSKCRDFRPTLEAARKELGVNTRAYGVAMVHWRKFGWNHYKEEADRLAEESHVIQAKIEACDSGVCVQV